MLDGRPYAAKSRKNKRQVLVAAFDHAVELELLHRIPFNGGRSQARSITP